VPIQVLFFALLIVAAVGICIWALRGINFDIPTRRRKVVRANLGPSVSSAPDMREVVLSQPAWERLGQPAIKRCADLARRVTPSAFLDSLEQRRNFAGLAAGWTMETLLAIKLVAGVAGLFFGLVVFLPNPSMPTFVIGALFAACGFYAVDLVLHFKAKERRTQIEHAFPNTIDQITICVESGLGLDAAIAHAARSGTGPLPDELARVMQDIQAGVSRQAALESLVERTEVSDIRHFVVAVGQANRYGVPVADVLRVQAEECRDRRKSRAEERAQKMSVTLLFPLVFCILPSLFIVILGPAIVRISNMNLGGH
jgi:tight adherence protein C